MRSSKELADDIDQLHRKSCDFPGLLWKYERDCYGLRQRKHDAHDFRMLGVSIGRV